MNEFNRKAVALLSGGLDSTLAICIVKEQGVEIEAVNIQTMFGCCKDDAGQTAQRLEVGFTLLKAGDDYLKTVEKPKYGYGRGMNPCVDCRIYMFEMAREFMDRTGASFLITGEVLDQRPMSQKRKDFDAIEHETALTGRIVRPLSAKQLPETGPEKAGILDRSQLYGIVGRSRRKLLMLAEKYGIENPPHPSAGCALTSPEFAKKVRDVFEHQPRYERWEFEILRRGRHFRITPESKVIVGRNLNDNEYFEYLHPPGTTLLSCVNFAGPHALVTGDPQPEALNRVGRVLLRYAQKPLPERCEIRAEKDGLCWTFETGEQETPAVLETLRIV